MIWPSNNNEAKEVPHKLFKWIPSGNTKRLRRSWNEGMRRAMENYGLAAENATDRH
jgi:hypothetical protein